MGMSGSGGAVPSINVTPLIDVLLVLLIIFMVISPLKPSRFEAQVPAEPKPEDKTVAKPNPNTLVIGVIKGSNPKDLQITLNSELAGSTADSEALTQKLAQIFKTREENGVFREGTNEVEKTVFIKSPRSVRYGEVVKVIDAAKIAGASPVGLQIDDLAQ